MKSKGSTFLMEDDTSFEIRALEAILESVFYEINRGLASLRERLPEVRRCLAMCVCVCVRVFV